MQKTTCFVCQEEIEDEEIFGPVHHPLCWTDYLIHDSTVELFSYDTWRDREVVFAFQAELDVKAVYFNV